MSQGKSVRKIGKIIKQMLIIPISYVISKLMALIVKHFRQFFSENTVQERGAPWYVHLDLKNQRNLFIEGNFLIFLMGCETDIT